MNELQLNRSIILFNYTRSIILVKEIFKKFKNHLAHLLNYDIFFLILNVRYYFFRWKKLSLGIPFINVLKRFPFVIFTVFNSRVI